MRYICPDYMFTMHPKSWNWDNSIEKKINDKKNEKKLRDKCKSRYLIFQFKLLPGCI